MWKRRQGDVPFPVKTNPIHANCSDIAAETSVLIKTMNRRKKVAHQITSIEKLYPGKFKILIGDDGKEDESAFYQKEGLLEGDRIQYFWFGFDFGVSEGKLQ